jgi:hypothetical protein
MTTTRTPDPALIIGSMFDPDPSTLSQYWYDPVAFVHDCFRWPAGRQPTAYQDRNLAALAEHKRVAVRGPHGLGKTAENSWAIHWFAITREDMAAHGVILDWKIPTTASVWRQLTKFLWPEIHKWAKMLDWDRLGRPPFTRHELLKQSLVLAHGEAFAVASDNPADIEGAHADHLFYVFDEAKQIAADTFDAAEGAFSGGGADTAAEAYALASSTPGEPQGRFYEIHSRKPGLDDWHPIHVTLDDTIAAGRVAQEWADQRRLQWGAASAVFHNRVLGEFYSSDADLVIPLSWVEAAIDRWHQYFDDDYDMPDGNDRPTLANFAAVGVDVSREGGDRTVLALRYGLVIAELRDQPVADTTITTDVTAGILKVNGGHAVVDVVGVGGGVVDQLKRDGYPVVAFSAGQRCALVDRSGELGFADKRAAAWWTLRELLDPAFDSEVALPPDDRLIGDLTAPRWKIVTGGKIRVESKDDIRKRLGRSTDDADAVVQAFWMEPPEIDEIIEQDEDERVQISRY